MKNDIRYTIMLWVDGYDASGWNEVSWLSGTAEEILEKLTKDPKTHNGYYDYETGVLRKIIQDPESISEYDKYNLFICEQVSLEEFSKELNDKLI